MDKIRNLSITGHTLKLIAVVTMLIDHLGASTLSYYLQAADIAQTNAALYGRMETLYNVMRQIGRLSFPIFCFLLVEGFVHTKNVKKYALRLFVFALISEIPFDMAFTGAWFDPGHQNIFFTLFIGLLVMAAASYFEHNFFLQVVIFALGMAVAAILKTDYSYLGIFVIVVLYVFRFQKTTQTIAGALSILWEPAAVFAFIPIWFYKGERGRQSKYFFYWFYPVHLFILGGMIYLMKLFL